MCISISKPQLQIIIFMEVVELKVRLHCKACEKSVRKTLSNLKGVTCVEIDVVSSKLTVLGYIDQNTVIKAVRKTGRIASDWSYHRHTARNGNFICSGSESGRRVTVSGATQEHSEKTKAPIMKERFLKRKSHFCHKFLMAVCLKGK